MPYIYTETHGKATREVYARRFPRDVEAITGSRFVFKWPHGVTRQQANDDLTIPAEFARRVAEARAEAALRETESILSVPFKPLSVDPYFFERTVLAARMLGANTLRWTSPPPPAPAPIGEAFGPQAAIDLWVLYRSGKGKETSDETRSRQRSKLDRLVTFLGHDDFRRVTETDLNAYVEQTLLGKWSASTVRDHIIMLKAVFGLAFKKQRITTNPAAKLEYARQTGNEREDFTSHERARIMRAAHQSNDPMIKWTNLLGGFSGARIAEIVEADTRDIVVEDGELIFFVQKKHRTGDEKTLKTRTSKRWFSVHSAIRHEFEQYVASLPPGPLFQDVKRYGSRRAKAASMAVADWMHDVVKIEASKSHHCWRHTVKTLLQANKIPDRLSDWITGHTGPASAAKRYLHPHIPEVKAAIEGLDNPL